MPVNLTDPIHVLMNDPTTGRLVEPLPIPPYTAQMPFMVIGWDGGGFAPDTHAGRAATCYYVLATAIPRAIEKLGRTPKWVATPELLVHPAAGKWLNAFFDRQNLKFFFAWDPNNNKYVYTAGSIDVIAHELGHALLDSVRPDFWNFAVPEIAAMHESFGDIHAFTTVMRHDKILVNALIETGGDLSKSNVISRLAEEMGTLYYKLPPGRTAPLRDAANDFKYVPPASLPATTDPAKLSAEPHSFSRVFTGAAYEVMIGIYESLVAEGKDGLDSIREAGDLLNTYLFRASLVVPASANFMTNFAKAILNSDQNLGGKYQEVMRSVFARRNLIVPAVGALAARGPENIETTEERDWVRLGSIMGIKSLSDDSCRGLLDVEVQIPYDSHRRYNMHGDLLDETVPDKAATHAAVVHYVDHLLRLDRIGDGKEFTVADGKLVRNHIMCRGGH